MRPYVEALPGIHVLRLPRSRLRDLFRHLRSSGQMPEPDGYLPGPAGRAAPGHGLGTVERSSVYLAYFIV